MEREEREAEKAGATDWGSRGKMRPSHLASPTVAPWA